MYVGFSGTAGSIHGVAAFSFFKNILIPSLPGFSPPTEDAVNLNEVFSSHVIRPLANDEEVVAEVTHPCLLCMLFPVSDWFWGVLV